jgi:hypothetical protein
VEIDWDATRYADKLPKKPANPGTQAAEASEASLRRQYPPRDDSAAGVPISRPCIIVDMQGIILAWYLPGILKDSRQVSSFTLSDHRIKSGVFQGAIMVATEKLHPLLGNRQTDASWRCDPDLFPPEAVGPKGLINISPAWFQQGHEVRCFSL